MITFPGDNDPQAQAYAQQLRTRQKRPAPTDTQPSIPTSSLPTIRPRKRRRTTLTDITNNGANRQIQAGGRKKKTAAQARAINTTPQGADNKALKRTRKAQHDVEMQDVRDVRDMQVMQDARPPLLPIIRPKPQSDGSTTLAAIRPSIRVVAPAPNPEEPPPPTFHATPQSTPSAFIHIDEIAPDPPADYAPRALRYHARQERAADDQHNEAIDRRRGPYRRGTEQLIAKLQIAMRLRRWSSSGYPINYQIPPTNAPTALQCHGRRNGVPMIGGHAVMMGRMTAYLPTSLSGRGTWTLCLKAPKRNGKRLWKKSISCSFEAEDVEVNGERILRRTQRSKDLFDNIVSYNNCLSFTSEGTHNIDHNVGRTTFRVQSSVHHLMGPLMADDGLKPKFAQIYTIDGTQEQLDTRQHYFEDLNRDTLHIMQRTLKKANPYVEGFKSCHDRLKEDEERYLIENMSVRIKQLDPRRQDKGIHNRPTSNEIAYVMGTPTDARKGRIERDIRVETKVA